MVCLNILIDTPSQLKDFFTKGILLTIPSGQFVVFDHPKFGLIPCISTIADIEEGEEVKTNFMANKSYSRSYDDVKLVDHQILVGYGYDLDESPEWYKVAWKNSIFGQVKSLKKKQL